MDGGYIFSQEGEGMKLPNIRKKNTGEDELLKLIRKNQEYENKKRLINE